MTLSQSMNLSTFGKLPCAQCGASLIAPLWSEFIDEHRVRHLWNCDECKYEFETMVVFCSSQTPGIVPSSLVA
jgi:hypothetical protein